MRSGTAKPKRKRTTLCGIAAMELDSRGSLRAAQSRVYSRHLHNMLAQPSPGFPTVRRRQRVSPNRSAAQVAFMPVHFKPYSEPAKVSAMVRRFCAASPEAAGGAVHRALRPSGAVSVVEGTVRWEGCVRTQANLLHRFREIDACRPYFICVMNAQTGSPPPRHTHTLPHPTTNTTTHSAPAHARMHMHTVEVTRVNYARHAHAGMHAFTRMHTHTHTHACTRRHMQTHGWTLARTHAHSC